MTDVAFDTSATPAPQTLVGQVIDMPPASRNLVGQVVDMPRPSRNLVGQPVDMYRIPQITLHAFCGTPETTSTIERVVADRRMSRVRAKMYPGGIVDAIDSYRNATSPNLLIVESLESRTDFLRQLEALADVCVSGTKVMVIGHTNDVTIYRELVARGVSEYIVAPSDPLSIIVGISRLYQQPGTSKLGRSLAFVGATGGAGTSTIAQNIASIIGRTRDCNVTLLDLDLPFGTASLAFDLNPSQGIAQALKDGSRLDDALLERLLTKCDDHLQMLTSPATLEQAYDLDESAFDRLLEVVQTSVPFVVLDVPHLWTSWAKKTLLAADEVVIVAQPNLAGLRNTKSMADLLTEKRPNNSPPKLVLNQIGIPKRSEITPDKFAAAVKLEPIACIPFDASTLSTAANSGQTIADVSAKSAVSRNLAVLAQVVAGRSVKKGRKGLSALSWIWNR